MQFCDMKILFSDTDENNVLFNVKMEKKIYTVTINQVWMILNMETLNPLKDNEMKRG